jgi:hypothetical protein
MTKTHGLSGTKAYKVWKSMNERCHGTWHKAFHRYGGRGIKVCERWRKFENFYADMGDPPPGLTLEREDNNGDYEPNNCVWATRKAQQNNLRSNVVFTFNGKTQTLMQWVNELGLSYQTVWQRIFRFGWSFEDAINCKVT